MGNRVNYIRTSQHRLDTVFEISLKELLFYAMISLSNGNIWIKCQSAYAGKINKRKELCGRVGAMKLSYSPEKLKEKSFLLVIDGNFDAEDIALLDKAGWDGIYYFDEIDELISSISGV